MSMMVSFVLSFFPRDVLDEILNLIESVSEDFPSYSCIERKITVCHVRTTITKSDCTANQPRIYLSLYSYPCVYAYTKLALEIRRLN